MIIRVAVLLDDAGEAADARAVHERAERAGRLGRGDRGAQRVGVGDVGGDELPAEVRGDLLALRRREVGDDHPPARGGDRLRGGQPEAGRATGDEGRDALEIHDRVPPVVDEVLPRTINSRN
jgi:hypothetical protein